MLRNIVNLSRLDQIRYQSPNIFQGGTKLFGKSTSRQNYVQQWSSNSFSFSYIKSLSKRYTKTKTILCLSRPHQNQHLEFASAFHQNRIKKYIEATSILRPSTLGKKEYIEMTQILSSSKFHRTKYVKTTSIFHPSKLRWYDVNVLLIEITQKKYIKMLWKFVIISSLTYWRNIDIQFDVDLLWCFHKKVNQVVHSFNKTVHFSDVKICSHFCKCTIFLGVSEHHSKRNKLSIKAAEISEQHWSYWNKSSRWRSLEKLLLSNDYLLLINTFLVKYFLKIIPI